MVSVLSIGLAALTGFVSIKIGIFCVFLDAHYLTGIMAILKPLHHLRRLRSRGLYGSLQPALSWYKD